VRAAAATRLGETRLNLVAPAEAGTQSLRQSAKADALDSRLRGNDGIQRMRLNQKSDSPADSSASAAAAIANSAETSVSFFSTVSLELSVS